MADCSKCNRTDIKCCHTCKKDAEKCNVWHNCGSDCPNFEAKVTTNADRIRSMSDEELAEFLAETELHGSQGKYEDYLKLLQSEAE